MNSDSEIDELFATLAQAGDEKLGSIVYGYDRVRPAAQEVLIEMLACIRSVFGQRLQVHVRRTSGPFELLIVQVPWKPSETESGFHPIIIGGEDSHPRIVGYVLCFNDIVQLFSPEDLRHIRVLSSFWADWVESFNRQRA